MKLIAIHFHIFSYNETINIMVQQKEMVPYTWVIFVDLQIAEKSVIIS
jgi:hypothetical protein